MTKKSRNNLRLHRKRRIRSKVNGTAKCPRLCIFRSLKGISVQLIDDENGKTLVAAGSWEIKSDPTTSRRNVGATKDSLSVAPRPPAGGTSETDKEKGEKNGIEAAGKTGELLAKKAEKKKIKQAVFDRGGYKYHGKVKALAEGARKGGLDF